MLEYQSAEKKFRFSPGFSDQSISQVIQKIDKARRFSVGRIKPGRAAKTNGTATRQERNYTPPVPNPSLNQAILNAEVALSGLQNEAGYWQFELESDCSISVEYALMMHFTGEIDELLQYKMAAYLRRQQADDGSFPLFPGGPGDVSLTTKAYYVLKLAGDSVKAPHMVQARNYVLSQGGAAKCNVLTRVLLATFQQLPWRGTPFVPVELMLLSSQSPINIYTLSYWARTVIVPLMVLCTLKATAKNPKQINIPELFVIPAEQEQHYFDDSSLFKKLFLWLDELGRSLEARFPERIRNRAIDKAGAWIGARLNGEDGLGALMPAMLYAYEAMLTLGTAIDDPSMVKAKTAMQRLLVVKKNEAYCQPAFSPVWDTAFAMLALQESKGGVDPTVNRQAADWLVSKQLMDEPGDWRESCPDFKGGGGWAFQFNSPHYPDIDDTGLAAFAIVQTQLPGYSDCIDNAARWLQVMQSRNGGYGAYDANNTNCLADASPLADYISLIDPPTADVSARCALFLARIVKDQPQYQATLKAAIDFLWKHQEADGSWFGRWGCNYLYGTWSVLLALEQAEVPCDDPRIQRAVRWLKSVQRDDGGWGEDNMTYHNPEIDKRGRFHTSTSFQTAWALLGLMAAGEADSIAVQKGIQFLLYRQQSDGLWQDENFSGAGFPKAVYLKYHGYEAYFPLWSLARYRNHF